MSSNPHVSFVLATHNRRDITLHTLGRLFGDRRPDVPCEVIVVDNASSDGTPDAMRTTYPGARLLAQSRNLGSCAKALGVDQARGRFVVFLDDDSYPQPGSVERMIEHFGRHPRLGAAGFRVHLPDGREECSALPDVFVGCGVGFRADALRQVGGLDAGLFMQAEEYDLSFRLINAGWSVQTFPDLHVDHLKTAHARRTGRTVYYDARNNLLIAARYLPEPYYRPYRDDWVQRYAWLAAGDKRHAAFFRGAVRGWLLGRRDRPRYADRRLRPDAFETLFRLRFVADRMQRLADTGVRRIVFAGLGKNILAFHRAAAQTGLSVMAIADDHFAGRDPAGRRYRGVRVIPLNRALALGADALVVSNTSPVHAEQLASQLAGLTGIPVHAWFRPEWSARASGQEQNGSTVRSASADNTVGADPALVAS